MIAESQLRKRPLVADDRLAELEPAEISRYDRHIILPNVGLAGQQKLKAARVLVIGAGGLGSPVSLYLAAAGVGTLGLVDSDVVDESNLQRQVLYGVSDVGSSKVDKAEARLKQLNPHTEIIKMKQRLSSANALEIIKDFDLVVDGTDNFPTRYLVNDACVLLGKAFCYGSIYQFEGQAAVFNHEGGPCYRCLYPEPPPPHLAPSCSEGGVFGVLPSIIGSIQATEAIKLILGLPREDILSGRYLLFDALSMSFRELKIKRDAHCAVCGDAPVVTDLQDYQQFCGLPPENAKRAYKEISAPDLIDMLAGPNPPTLLDVREDHERETALIPQALHIPMNDVETRLHELEASGSVVVHCKSGARSAKVCDALVAAGFADVTNLKGGIQAFQAQSPAG